jgi:hypothetical protein
VLSEGHFRAELVRWGREGLLDFRYAFLLFLFLLRVFTEDGVEFLDEAVNAGHG